MTHPEVEKTQLLNKGKEILIDEKQERKKHEEKMEKLRHKNIMEEIALMGKYKITHFNRRS